ncbi:MAG: polysaccharide biosynthesis/export family protein [Pseudomonadota bacterium]
MTSPVFIRIIFLFAFCAFTACASYKPLDPAFHKALSQPYMLNAGDELRVTVFGQDELTNNYTVDKSGHIAFPLVGSIAAKGSTPKQMERKIAFGLKRGFLRDPDVSVEVSTYRPFFIMGEVGTAGQYTYVPGMTVQQAIAIAGGFSPRAEQINADITRTISGEIITGRVPISDPIMPGDTIFIRERMF